MEGPSVNAYREGSAFLQQCVALIPPAEWDRPGLGGWTLRELTAHANRAYTTVEAYLLHPQEPEPPTSTYFSDAAIEDRARQSLAVLGDDPASALEDSAARVIPLIERTDPGATIGSPVGTMTLARYLPSRVAEMTIHGLDIVHALGAKLEAPRAALTESLAFVASFSVRKGAGETVLMALSGRGELPEGFSVY